MRGKTNNRKTTIDPVTGEEVEHGFTGIWIDSVIFENKKLSWIEMLLMGIIHSLGKSKKGCFASNKYFSQLFGVSETNISNSISNLKKEGMVEQKSFDGRRRILISKLVLRSDK